MRRGKGLDFGQFLPTRQSEGAVAVGEERERNGGEGMERREDELEERKKAVGGGEKRVEDRRHAAKPIGAMLLSGVSDPTSPPTPPPPNPLRCPPRPLSCGRMDHWLNFRPKDIPPGRHKI